MSEKYSIGDYVVYDIYGICKITAIQNLSLISGTPKKNYYVLSPLNVSSSTYYVPVSGEASRERLRLPMSENEIKQLLLRAKNIVFPWAEKRQERLEKANRVLSEGITAELVSMLGCFYNKKKDLEACGKKLSATDENIFFLAEKALKEEFSFSLGIPQDEVSEYIHTFMHSDPGSFSLTKIPS